GRRVRRRPGGGRRTASGAAGPDGAGTGFVPGFRAGRLPRPGGAVRLDGARRDGAGGRRGRAGLEYRAAAGVTLVILPGHVGRGDRAGAGGGPAAAGGRAAEPRLPAGRAPRVGGAG